MKGRLSLISGYTAYYTLGQISPEFKKVVVISTPLSEDKKTVKANTLSEYKILSSILLLDLQDLQKLKPLDFDNKLKVGSKVRYEQKNFEVAGIFKNTYAQLYIKSPILLQPFAIFNDISSALYSTLNEDEIIKNINNNFRNGKYDADILFRFIDSNNFKEKLYNVKAPPPLSSLQSVKLKKDLEINPSTFEGYIPIGQKMMVFYEKRANVYVKDYSDVENANIDLGSNKLKEFNFPFTLYSNSLKPNQSLNFPTLTDEDVIIQPQREILPLSFGIPLSSTLEATSISDIGNASKYDKVASTLEFMGIKMPMIIAQMIVSNSFTNLATFDLGYFFDIYVNEARSGRPYFQTTERPDYLYILEENSKIGEYTFSSKLHLKDSVSEDLYDKLLSFNDIVFLRKKPFYVLKYFNVLSASGLKGTFCLLFNEEMKGKNINTKTLFKKSFKIVEANSLYKSFNKDGIKSFGISSKFYLTQSNNETDFKESRKNIVTDLFLDKKMEQLQKLKEFNPNLFNSFLLATKLVDKKLEKGEVKVNKKSVQRSPYILVTQTNENNYYEIDNFLDEAPIGIPDLNFNDDLSFIKSYLNGKIIEKNPFKNSYKISDKVWYASCVAHFGVTSTSPPISQFFDIKDIQDYTTCMIFLELVKIMLTGSNNIDTTINIYNESFGFNAFKYSYTHSTIGNYSWRSNSFIKLNMGHSRMYKVLIDVITESKTINSVYELAQNMFSINGLLQVAYTNRINILQKQQGLNYNNLFSKFNLSINISNLNLFVDKGMEMSLKMDYPSLNAIKYNIFFAPQSKLEISGDIPQSGTSNEIGGISKTWEEFTESNFLALITDLLSVCPDYYDYIKIFQYDSTKMGIREYEKIEIEEETQQEDLTTDIDNIFAETFEDEIDDIFADTF